MHSDPSTIIVENRWAIIARSIPDAVIVDRTAARGGMVDGGIVTVSSDERSSDLELPGLLIRVRPLRRHSSDTPWPSGLTASSPARTILDNLAPSRARSTIARTLTPAELQDWLAEKRLQWGAERISTLRSDAQALAIEWNLEERVDALERIFDEIEGRRKMAHSAGAFARAAASGSAWDERRLGMFESVAVQLNDLAAAGNTGTFPAGRIDGELPFYEAYFSNYIEGTEFTVEEARQIIETQTPPARRTADGHDILGTHRCCVDPVGRSRTSTDTETLIELMKVRHRTLMVGRPDIGPGEYKDLNNRAGAVDFVDHKRVAGTVARAFERVADIPAGFHRAIYMMFVVAEIHPFTDGNGRTARLMMNAELSAAGACRIVIPTILRNEYISALRRASNDNGDISSVVTVLRHSWRWTAAMPWTDRPAVDGQMIATNALTKSDEAAERHLQLQLP